MKKVLSLIAIVLLAMPAFGQDDIILTGGDIDALLGGGNRGNRGGNNNQPQIPDPVVMFEDLKALLKDNKVALDKNQEKALRTLLNEETVAMRTVLEAQFNRGGNRGNSNSNQSTMITDLNVAVSKHNSELLAEIKAALMPDQVALVTKAEKDNKKVCTVMLDLINFQELQTRFSNNSGGGRGGFGGGRGGPGGFELGGLDLGGFELGGGGGGGGGGRGGNNNQNAILQVLPNRASCTSSASTTAQRLAVLGDVLTKGKKPLTADQGTKFSPLIEARMKTMLDELKAKDPQIERLVNDLGNQNRNNQNQNQNQIQNQTPQVNVQTLTNNIVNTIMQNLGIQNTNNNNNNNRGGGGRGNDGRGNPGGTNNTASATANTGGRGNPQQNINPQAEIQKKNEELLDKVAAMLKPEQQPVIKKLKYDQIKARGAVDKYRGVLEKEGTPLAPEQATQITQILNATNQAVRTFAQGLVTTEIQALPPGALETAAQQILQQQQQQQQQQQDPRQNRGNSNAVNNVSQNGVAQQIVSKVINQVSVQRARLDKIASDQIMTRVLTPAQQASYKVSQMN